MVKICKEALLWVLHRLDFQVFRSMLKANPQFRMTVYRGGFKITPEKFRQPRTRERLIAAIARDELMVVFFITEGVRRCSAMKGLEEGYQALSQPWLKKNWLPWLRSLRDARPLAFVLTMDKEAEWARRLGERLLATSMFWRKSPLPLKSQDPALLAIEPELVEECRDKWEAARKFFVKRDGAAQLVSQEEPPADGAEGAVPAGGVSADGADAHEPSRPVGLVPLTKGVEATPPQPQPEKAPEEAAVAVQEAPKAAGSERIGDLARERDQLAKQLRIQKELHLKEMAAMGAEVQELQGRLAECAENFSGAVEEIRQNCEQETRRQIADFEAMSLGVHPDSLAFAVANRQTREQLRERVTLLLNKQRENNRRFRTRQMVREDLQKVDQYLSQVNRVIEDALQPIPGLCDLQQELEAKVQELTRQLNDDTEGLDLRNAVMVLPPRLSAYITEIPWNEEAQARYAEVRQMLESPLGRALFTPEEIQAATDLLERRSRLATQAMESASRVTVMAEDESVTGRLQVYHQLTPFLDRFKEVDLFVDAYNVIKNDPYWAALEQTTNGFQTARGDFIDKCRRKARLFHSMTLVFDSDLPTANTEKEGNFIQIYPAKKSVDQNADNFIVEELQRQAARDEEEQAVRLRWLVTNDHGLRDRVCNSCAAVVANACFAIFLKS